MMKRVFTIALGVLSFTLAGAAVVYATRPIRKPRAGWEEQFRLMARRGDDKLIPLPATTWDDEQWEW